jgi:hypothetical protein
LDKEEEEEEEEEEGTRVFAFWGRMRETRENVFFSRRRCIFLRGQFLSRQLSKDDIVVIVCLRLRLRLLLRVVIVVDVLSFFFLLLLSSLFKQQECAKGCYFFFLDIDIFFPPHISPSLLHTFTQKLSFTHIFVKQVVSEEKK